MNPLYNNRTYYLNNSDVSRKIFSDIAYDGASVQGTKEFANTRIVITQVDNSVWGLSYSQVVMVEQLLKAIREQDGDMINDIYDAKYYLFLKDEIEAVKEQFKIDCVGTRRAVFAFPASHCFDSIQVLMRDGEVITTVNMRSCNAYKNLMCDLYLAHRLAYEATRDWAKQGRSLIANIGSLHIFKEDVKNVL